MTVRNISINLEYLYSALNLADNAYSALSAYWKDLPDGDSRADEIQAIMNKLSDVIEDMTRLRQLKPILKAIRIK